ncbi:MAG: hypothetical protein ACI85O_002443 [Saprospiraceae bacterium]|jgi:hypothetical protein
MKKVLFLSIYLFLLNQLIGQTEKGMLLLGGKVFSNSSLSTNSRTNETNHFISAQSEVGVFLSKRNLLGTRLSFQLNDNKKKNVNTQEVEENLDYQTEISNFYRFYPMPNKRFGLFGETQLTLIGNSQNTDAFHGQFKAQIGAGVYLFMTRNLAFEMSFLTPLYYTQGLDNPPKLIANFSLIRNFKRPVQTLLPKLEDTYLFVRNFYYGLGIRRSSDNIPLNQISVNTGFFISSHWLIDVNYSFEDFDKGFRSNSFGDLRIESAFFIRLNQKGTYLRPSVSFKLETGDRLRIANPSLAGFQKFAYIGNLEVAKFIGDQLIFGGGGSIVMTRFDIKANHIQFNGNIRLTYFINKDFAIELKGAYYINDSFVNNTPDPLILELTQVNTELKIRHFFFQK